MSRPRLLDLFCGAGGAAVGYDRAGFEVVGVDIRPQPHYPFEFHQADAINYLLCNGPEPLVWEFQAIHASPPCQRFTTLRTMWNHGGDRHPDLIEPIRKLLAASGLPYVIENVPGSPLLEPARLCGSSFGLGVEVYDGWRQLRRHRLFETSFLIDPPRCSHGGATIGIYGDHARDRRRKERNGVRIEASRDFPDSDRLKLAQDALDMPWVPVWHGLSEAIPPAYTEWIGRQLMASLESATKA